MTTIITDEWLRRRRACAEQKRTFRNLFPDGADLTIENAEKAYKAGMDITWATIRCLDRKGRQEFILFCLRQAQPHLVKLFEEAKQFEGAKILATRNWTELPREFRRARGIDAAGAASCAAAVVCAAAGTHDVRLKACREQWQWVEDYLTGKREA